MAHDAVDVELPTSAAVGLIVWLPAFGPLWSALFDIGGVFHHRP